jgi:hypothetical protein
MFLAARLKLKRAESLIAELQAAQDEYAASNPITGRFDISTEPPTILVLMAEVPDTCATVLGDAVHNIRSSLDLMATELARATSDNDKKVYFPIADSEETLDVAINNKKFHRCGADAVALLKTVSPFRGGNDYLRAVHDLDVRDKHCGLLVVGRSFECSFEGSINLENYADNKLSIKASRVTLGFPEDDLFGGMFVIEVLQKAVEEIERIFQAFESLVKLRAAAT